MRAFVVTCGAAAWASRDRRDPEPIFAVAEHVRRPPRLLDVVRDALRTRHLSRRTEEAYVAWIRRYVVFRGKRHPREMGVPEVARFLTSLAVERKVSASTQNQAMAALLFLYRHVLAIPLEGLDAVRARGPARLPVVLTRDEVRAVIERMHGLPRLMAVLMYGCGLRLLECAQLRVKDVDFGANHLVVRQGKGGRDRLTVLPAAAREGLARQLEAVRRRHAEDLRRGGGWVELPDALARKYPNAGREPGWQWVFPATRSYVDAVSGQRRRHHLHETVVQRSVKQAVRVAGHARERARLARRYRGGALRH